MATNKPVEYFGKDLEAMSFATNYYKWILSELMPYFGNSVAEIGAGTGNFSKMLLETKISSLVAYEPSCNMFPLLQEALKKEVRVKTVNDCFGKKIEEQFDSILYINVLEHIENDKAELIKAKNALSSGGHLLIFVPAQEWLYSDFDKNVGHFRRYTKKTITELITSIGFSVLKVRYFDFLGIIPWFINFTLLGNSMNIKIVLLYDKYFVPLLQLVEKRIPPLLGKNILLVAKKMG